MHLLTPPGDSLLDTFLESKAGSKLHLIGQPRHVRFDPFWFVALVLTRTPLYELQSSGGLTNQLNDIGDGARTPEAMLTGPVTGLSSRATMASATSWICMKSRTCCPWLQEIVSPLSNDVATEDTKRPSVSWLPYMKNSRPQPIDRPVPRQPHESSCHHQRIK